MSRITTDRPTPLESRKPAFQVDATVTVKLDVGMAVQLGQFIIESILERKEEANPAFFAFAKQLTNIKNSVIPPVKDEDEKDDYVSQNFYD